MKRIHGHHVADTAGALSEAARMELFGAGIAVWQMDVAAVGDAAVAVGDAAVAVVAAGDAAVAVVAVVVVDETGQRQAVPC
jgi:hypothetical protein